ncbi:MAG TPA: ribosome small subunit-dependent GTPase A, partial [Patescibacteria group bacterium]|nr:ribosome small subunit-dependent GTPase A [Patescibacteria group bacterium]
FGTEYLVGDGAETRRASASSRLQDLAGATPSVGDWVAVQRRESVDLIRAVVARRTVFSRKAAAAESREQVLAANVDVAFVVAAATDVNQRRIERYLTIAWQSGASPVVLLTKADVADATEPLRDSLAAVSIGTPVAVTSSVTGEGLDEIGRMLRPSLTGVLLGPSGAGKSSLNNRLLGHTVMQTREVHRSGEGRHVTSHRHLFQLPGGGMIIDTPGLREAQLWEGAGALADVFGDVESLARECRFHDCPHDAEPGCAVKAALETGALDFGRLRSYRKLQRELQAVAMRSDARLRADERRKWKRISMANRSRERYLR